jgi:outer membrane protein insertion porin family
MSGTDLPIPERFYVGGINTVRGFKFGRAGPIDPATNEVLGGNKELVFNVEYIFPLVPEAKVKGVLFFDDGRAFDDTEPIRISDLRRGAGIELRWISPIGPLRLEWGYNISPQGNEAHSVVEFTIGTLF